MRGVLLLFAILLIGCGREADAPREAPAPAAAAEPASASTVAPAAADQAPTIPTLSVDTLDHGRFDLAEQRGKWVVVNYWATWCAPCLKEMPELSAFGAERRDNVSVIGLAFEEIDEADMRAFLDRRPAGYPIALIDVYAPPTDFDIPRGLPMTYLIAPDGTVANRFMGPVTAESLVEAMAQHEH